MVDPWLDPLLDAATMRAADSWAIEDRGIPSLDLMETAGIAVADAAAPLAGEIGPVRVVCGKGNNAGDGVVAARHLREAGYEVELLLLYPPEELSPDTHSNFERYSGITAQPGPARIREALVGSSVVIDAMLGTGFDGEPREPLKSAIEAVNSCPAPVIACDIPSGVSADDGSAEGVAVEAELTVTFHASKLGHWIHPGKWMSGELVVADIGIPYGAPVTPPAGTIGVGVLSLPPRRHSGSTKFSSGQVVVAAGSRGLSGAACLTSQAAARGGAGYVTALCPASIEPILEVKLTEVMTAGLADEEGAFAAAAAEEAIEHCARAGCLVIGPGIGRAEGAQEFARRLARAVEVPVLIDADGLNAHDDPSALAELAGPLVLTPHAGELARMLGLPSDEVEEHRLDAARDLAVRTGGVVVLKGDDTIVTDGERIAVNAIPAPALATAGTGDVLSGLIAALIARGCGAWEAACAGVCAHARAGQRVSDRIGADSVIASDVIGAIPAGLSPL